MDLALHAVSWRDVTAVSIEAKVWCESASSPASGWSSTLALPARAPPPKAAAVPLLCLAGRNLRWGRLWSGACAHAISWLHCRWQGNWNRFVAKD